MAKGDQEWFKDGQLHRDNDKPASVSRFCEGWYQNGMRHRGGGHAVAHPEGYQEWWQNDKRQREKGLAFITHEAAAFIGIYGFNPA